VCLELSLTKSIGVELSWTVLEVLDGKGDDWTEEFRDCLGVVFVETNRLRGRSHFPMSESWEDAMMIQNIQVEVVWTRKQLRKAQRGHFSEKSRREGATVKYNKPSHCFDQKAYGISS
jgi:hypothetical protein